MISQRDRDRAAMMLYELEGQRLMVVLLPSTDDAIAGDGGKRRAVAMRNCSWYRRFCSLYDSGRKRPRRKRHHDTLIKREATQVALRKLMRGMNDCIYTRRLLDFIEMDRERQWAVYRPVDVDSIPI